MSAKAASDFVGPAFFNRDSDSLEKDDGKTLEAIVPFGKKVSTNDIPAKIRSDKSTSKYDFYALSENCYLVTSKRESAEELKNAAEGQLLRVMGSFKKAQAGRTKTGRMDYRFLLECRKVEIAYGFQPFERGAEFDPGKYPFSTTKRLRDRFQRSVGYPFRTELDFDELGNLSSEDASMLALDRIQWDMIRHTTDDGIPLLFLPISAKVDRDRLRGLKKGGKIQVYGRLYGAIRDGNPVPALIVDAVEFDAPKVEVNEDGYIVITKRELVKGYEARHEKKYQVHFVYRGIGSIPAKIKKEVPFLQKYEGKLLRSEHNDLEGLGNEPPVVVIMPDAGDKDLAVLAKAEPGDTLVMNCHVYAKDGKRLLFVKDFELPPIRPGGE